MTRSPAEPQLDTPLALKIKAEIRSNGPISVSRFMSLCLWDEEHGYYRTQRVIGAAGDFITAAEVSQIFGELIGLWAAIVWQEVFKQPAEVRVVEYGPGRGTLMRDALRASRVVAGFAAAARVHLVEMSNALADIQRATLKDVTAEVTWSKNLAGFGAPAIIFANEFVDAWPVTQWVRGKDFWQERGVGLDENNALTFTVLDRAELPEALALPINDAPPGSIVESQKPRPLVEALRRIAAKGPVAALIIDYGYTVPSQGDTLQAVRQHRYEPPLAAPGEADLSAHVNFYELAVLLHGAGLAIDGPVTQAEFLGSLGAIERASRLMAANPSRAGEIETGIARLLAPNGMGTRFKVLGVRSADLAPLPGFAAAR